MLTIAKRKAVERKIGNIHFAQATIFDARYQKESFSVIFACNILHLLEDTPKVMKRINELLKPGGLFISDTPCLGEKNPVFSIFLFLANKVGLVPYVQSLKSSELEGTIANGAFQIVEAEMLDQGMSSSYFMVAKKK